MKRYFHLIILYLTISFAAEAQHYYLYGATTQGGVYDSGTIFRFDPSTGKDTVLFSFNGTNGYYPCRTFLQTANGLLYSTSEFGGNFSNVINNDGVFFSYDLKTGKEKTGFDFNDTINGFYPFGKLVQDSNGIIYGTTGGGGTFKSGTIFSYNPLTNTDTVVFNFNDSISGAVDYGGFLQLKTDLLYSMTEQGGKYGSGVIFSFNTKTYKDSVLFNFNGTNGGYTQGYLIRCSDGLLYGLTADGGTKNDGVLFSFDLTNNKENVLVDFDSVNGAMPFGSLLQASNGLLYGMAAAGGKNNNGIMFSYNMVTGKDSIVIEFKDLNNAGYPGGELIEDTVNKVLYGMASQGGTFNKGVIFSYNLKTGKDSVLLNFNGSNGSTPYGDLLLVKDTLTGINEVIAKYKNIQVYPNPANTILNIKVELAMAEADNICLYNELGEQIECFELKNNVTVLPISTLASGIYLYRITDKNGSIIGLSKVMIEH